ncbi:MAG: dCTP deaminase [Gloeomargarita sp. GMQP_bins_120]
MVLTDHELNQLCQGTPPLVAPFDPTLLNPASLDIRIGTSALIEQEDGEQVPLDLTPYDAHQPYILEPQTWLLVASLEMFHIPDFLAGEVRLKSSRAREGFDLALALWLDPGWHGSHLTMALRNTTRFRRLGIYPGMKIAQVILHRLSNRPQRSYAQVGRYNRDRQVQGSKD